MNYLALCYSNELSTGMYYYPGKQLTPPFFPEHCRILVPGFLSWKIADYKFELLPAKIGRAIHKPWGVCSAHVHSETQIHFSPKVGLDDLAEFRDSSWTGQVSFLEICLQDSSLLSFIGSHWEGTRIGARSSHEIGKLIDPFGRKREEEELEEVNV